VNGFVKQFVETQNSRLTRVNKMMAIVQSAKHEVRAGLDHLCLNERFYVETQSVKPYRLNVLNAENQVIVGMEPTTPDQVTVYWTTPTSNGIKYYTPGVSPCNAVQEMARRLAEYVHADEA